MIPLTDFANTGNQTDAQPIRMTSPASAAPRSRFRARDAIYLLLIGAAVAANGVFQLDADPGGYPDRWLTIDKMIHFAIAYAVVIAGRMFGVRQSVALGGIIVAAVAFEFTQGFVSWRDILAGIAGALVAAAWWLIPERRENPR